MDSNKAVAVLREETYRLARKWAAEEYRHANNMGKGGPGLENAVAKACNAFSNKLDELAAHVAEDRAERAATQPAGEVTVFVFDSPDCEPVIEACTLPPGRHTLSAPISAAPAAVDSPTATATAADAGSLKPHAYEFWDGDEKDGREKSFAVFSSEDPATGRPDHQGHIWKSIPMYTRPPAVMAGDLPRVETPNPFPEGSPNENWRRGYQGVRHFGARDSIAAKLWKMGRDARKADEKAWAAADRPPAMGAVDLSAPQEAKAEPVGGLPQGVTVSAFRAAHDRAWWISIRHPFGSTNHLCTQIRDVQLAELLAARTPASVTSADAANRDMLLRAKDALIGLLTKRGYGCGEGSDYQVETHNNKANKAAHDAIAEIDTWAAQQDSSGEGASE